MMVKVKDNLTFFEAMTALDNGLLIFREDAPNSFNSNWAYVKMFGGILYGSFRNNIFANISQLQSMESARFSFGAIKSTKWASYAMTGTLRYDPTPTTTVKRYFKEGSVIDEEANLYAASIELKRQNCMLQLSRLGEISRKNIENLNRSIGEFIYNSSLDDKEDKEFD